jgi:glycosyltransferase involved in cell wall biosynthesis
MPIIEGQAIGRPVLTSHRVPMTEISGDAVFYVDPESVDSMRQGFLEIIRNEILRKDIVAKGQNNVKRFDAEVIAEKYMALYNIILSKK